MSQHKGAKGGLGRTPPKKIALLEPIYAVGCEEEGRIAR